jgi:hypothetical protein
MRSFFRRRFLDPLINERGDFGGFLVLAGAVALAGVVYLAIFHGTAEQGIIGLARAQVLRVNANYALLVHDFGEIKPGTPIPANDGRVLEIKDALSKLNAFAEQVREKARNSVEGSITDSAIKTFNEATACVVDPPTPSGGSPSQAKAITVHVQARVPLPQGTPVSLTSDKGDTGSMDACVPPICNTPFSWIGNINLTANDPSLSGTTTKIQVSGPNIACNAVAFQWKFDPPKIVGFTKTPTNKIQPGTKVTLKSVTQNARDVDINGTAVGNPLGVMEVSPSETTLYTLTAVSTNPATPNVSSKDTATLTVEVDKSSFAITLSGGGPLNETTDFSVTVSGQVTPAPPAGTLVSIKVNTVPVATVGVDGGGGYVATVTLPKTMPPGTLQLINGGTSVSQCGDPSSGVFLDNNATAADVTNSFEAAVVKAGGGTNSNAATLNITHAVKVTSDALVTWTGQCAGPNQNLGGKGRIMTFGVPISFDPITCSLQCSPVGQPPLKLSCSPVARVTVSTTVGSLFKDGTWDIQIK